VIPPVVLQSDLDALSRLCLAVLVMHGEVAFPSHQQLASLIGCSVGGVRKSLARLRVGGWLLVERRVVRGRGQLPNRYRVTVPQTGCPVGTPPVSPGDTPPCPVGTPQELFQSHKIKEQKEDEEQKSGTSSPRGSPPSTESDDADFHPIPPGHAARPVPWLVGRWYVNARQVNGRPSLEPRGKVVGQLVRVVRLWGADRTAATLDDYWQWTVDHGRRGGIDDYCSKAELIYDKLQTARHPAWREER
jgi:hypothetical protein